ALSLQFRLEHTYDDYDGRDLGVESGKRQLVGVDANYVINDEWKLTGWVTLTRAEIEQSATDRDSDEWDADLDQVGKAFGLGLRGTPRDDLNVGLDLQYVRDDSEHDVSDRDGLDALKPLPDIEYEFWSARAFGEYTLDASSAVRLDLVYEKRKDDDWVWLDENGDTWHYYDGTEVYPEHDEDVVFVGISYRYTWR
ncbi:MAG TPA: MtrB/PioB family outer membrane beta-barrel protein, partial [Gammaproteobacteria bacterium]